MPSVDVEENIKKIQEAIESTYQELHRLQGSLRVFLGFKEKIWIRKLNWNLAFEPAWFSRKNSR